MGKQTVYRQSEYGDFRLVYSEASHETTAEEAQGYFFTPQELEDKLREAFNAGNEFGFSNAEEAFTDYRGTVKLPNEDNYIASLNLRE